MTVNEQAVVLSYKAYSKKYLKKYESAKKNFSELIEVMKDGGFNRNVILCLL